MAILRKPEHLWPALWAGVLLVLVAVLAAEHYLGRVTVGEGPRPPAKIVEARLLPAFELPAETQATPETLARPLFVPARRPSPPAAATAVPTMKKGQFVLTGVTVAPDIAFAFLKEVSSGKTQSVRKGTQVNGITVEAVEARRVVLRLGEESEELPLNIQVPARVAAAATPTGAVPPAPGAMAAPGAPGAALAPGTAPVPAGTAPTVPGMRPGVPTPGVPSAMPAPGAAPAAPAPPAASATASGRRRPWINAQ